MIPPQRTQDSLDSRKQQIVEILHPAQASAAMSHNRPLSANPDQTSAIQPQENSSEHITS
jgi:hypothetical protein